MVLLVVVLVVVDLFGNPNGQRNKMDHLDSSLNLARFMSRDILAFRSTILGICLFFVLSFFWVRSWDSFEIEQRNTEPYGRLFISASTG